MCFGEAEDDEAFREVGFSPGGKFGLGFGVGFDKTCKTDFSVGPIVSVKDRSDVCGDFAFEFLLGDTLLSVLLEVKLATLPRGGGEASFERGAQTSVGI